MTTRHCLSDANAELIANGLTEFEAESHRDRERAKHGVVLAPDLPCEEHPEAGRCDDEKHGRE